MKVETEEGARTRGEQRGETARRGAMNDRVWREIVSWFWVILAFLVIEGTGVQARVIPSGSMENTVLVGDHLIVSRAGYDAGVPFTDWHVPLWRNPHRRQIIVFQAPINQSEDFIKRVIGVPGDRIKIEAGQVFVNGVPLKEPYAKHEFGYQSAFAENFPARVDEMTLQDRPEWGTAIWQHVSNGELVVPPNEYFVMGDNRDDSDDSRYWGFVPRANIIGTPVVIYMSIRAPDGDAWEPGHLGERFATYFSALIHPKEVRWSRLFHTFHY